MNTVNLYGQAGTVTGTGPPERNEAKNGRERIYRETAFERSRNDEVYRFGKVKGP